jgi:hypothetical protein
MIQTLSLDRRASTRLYLILQLVVVPCSQNPHFILILRIPYNGHNILEVGLLVGVVNTIDEVQQQEVVIARGLNK